MIQVLEGSLAWILLGLDTSMEPAPPLPSLPPLDSQAWQSAGDHTPYSAVEYRVRNSFHVYCQLQLRSKCHGDISVTDPATVLGPRPVPSRPPSLASLRAELRV